MTAQRPPIELHKTLGYSFGERHGRSIAIQTLASGQRDQLANVLLGDINQILAEAQFQIATPKQQIAAASLVGYIRTLAQAAEFAASLGVSFTAASGQGSDQQLGARIDYPQAPAPVNPITGKPHQGRAT